MRVWPDALRGWKNPPVVETAISAQFAPIEGLTGAHVGWFWRQYLDSTWVKVLESSFLEDQFEKFDQTWNVPFLRFAEKPPVRHQITNVDGDRIIQIQNTRFVYNWRKRGGEYPSFGKTFDEFSARLEDFRTFLRVAGLGETQLNQWELTYIDHIPKGVLWETPGDFHRILPGLFAESQNPDTLSIETTSSEQHFNINKKLGRVHIFGRHVKPPDDIEILALQSTARGPIMNDRADFGLRLGHEAIGRTFLAIISDAAIGYWRDE